MSGAAHPLVEHQFARPSNYRPEAVEPRLSFLLNASDTWGKLQFRKRAGYRMKPWIDPRERRARSYFSALFVIGTGALIVLIILMLTGDPSPEEVGILLAAAVILVISLFFGGRTLRRLPREYQQHGEEE